MEYMVWAVNEATAAGFVQVITMSFRRKKPTERSIVTQVSMTIEAVKTMVTRAMETRDARTMSKASRRKLARHRAAIEAAAREIVHMHLTDTLKTGRVSRVAFDSLVTTLRMNTRSYAREVSHLTNVGL